MNGLRRDDLDVLFPGLLDALLAAAARQAARAADRRLPSALYADRVLLAGGTVHLPTRVRSYGV
ncbi:hypothetical protein SFUMM280S_07449 [Streptomyces fumanus]